MKVNPIPEGYHTITPYLVVSDADKLMTFLKAAFNASGTACGQNAAGQTLHAEMKIGNSMVMIGRVKESSQASTSMLYLYVNDTDKLYQQAMAAGAISLMEPADQFYGDRNAGIQDPCGNQWWIATRVENLTPEELAERSKAYQTQA